MSQQDKVYRAERSTPEGGYQQSLTIQDLEFRLKDLEERYGWLKEETTNLTFENNNLKNCIKVLKNKRTPIRKPNLKYRQSIGDLSLL